MGDESRLSSSLVSGGRGSVLNTEAAAMWRLSTYERKRISLRALGGAIVESTGTGGRPTSIDQSSRKYESTFERTSMIAGTPFLTLKV
jgi:hypothetical protein